MSMQLDMPNVTQAIIDTIKNYGTRTQGEDYRINQVASRITEMFNDLMEVNEAMKEYSGDTRVYFYIKAG